MRGKKLLISLVLLLALLLLFLEWLGSERERQLVEVPVQMDKQGE